MCRSEVGKGTVFTVHLPRHAGKMEEVQAVFAEALLHQDLLTLVRQGLEHRTG